MQPLTIRSLIGACVLVLVAGCASLNPDYEAPIVNVQSFRALPMDGAGLPNFEVGLQVLNPNPEPLELEGVSYRISLNGQDLINGVANDLPVIEGYGEGTVTLTASISVIGSIRLVQRLMNEPQDTVEYVFSARLDPAGFGRTIRVEEAGQISLTGQ
ncbi:MAG: LEA type 2 family protein [Pseudomonadota bacterium]